MRNVQFGAISEFAGVENSRCFIEIVVIQALTFNGVNVQCYYSS